jgi:type I restriction enzyme, S subunit
MVGEPPVTHPGEWPVVRLGDIVLKIGSGATPRGGDDSYLAKRFKFALVRSQNVFDRRFDTTGLAFISDEQADRLKSVTLQSGDLLLNITGDGITFARSCGVPKEILPACVNQHVAIIRVDRSVADPGYILSYLTHPAVKRYIESFNAGGSRRAITKGNIESFLLPLPPLPEQRTIANILSILDDKIELNHRVNETLEAITKAIFKSWFVDFDPVRAKAEGRASGLPGVVADLFPASFAESDFDGIPEGWSLATLGDVAENPRRGIDPNEIEPSTPYIGLEHMPRKRIALSDWGHADELESNKFEFRGGEILFGKLRPYFHKVGIAPLNGVCSTDILVVTPKDPEWFAFVLGHVSSTAFVEHTNAGSTGTKMPRTSWHEMARYRVAMPPKPVAAKFAEVAGPFLERIATNIHESRTLASLRDSLLPRLVSGELRVKRSNP